MAMPLTLICVSLLLAALIKNVGWRRRLFWTGLGMLLFFSNEFIANEVMLTWEIKAIPFSRLGKHKLGIVLTGATIPFLKPDDRVYFQRGADRVTHTVQLYKLGLIEKILVSGGSGRIAGDDEPEANKFKKAMVLMGVPDSVILIENETRNTHESAIEVKKILSRLHYEDSDCILITSGFHMRRSLACYRKVGLELKPFSTDFYSYPDGYQLDAFIIPKADSIMIWHKLVKEWIGFVMYKLAGYI